MASDYSFDVVSEFDKQELVNAIDISRREISNRYDLKDTKSEIEYKEDSIFLTAPDDYKVKAIFDILQSKSIKRGLSIKIFDTQKLEAAFGGTCKQEIKLRNGLKSDQAKLLNKKIRERFPKVKIQIQGESVRVFHKSKDGLQEVIAFLKELDYENPLQFINFR